MKQLFNTILAILLTATAFAQADLLQKANELYTRDQFKPDFNDQYGITRGIL
jgi:hypothetical protein